MAITFKVKVVDSATSAVIPGATVEFSVAGVRRGSGVTDSAGELIFRFPDSDAGKQFTGSITKEGYETLPIGGTLSTTPGEFSFVLRLTRLAVSAAAPASTPAPASKVTSSDPADIPLDRARELYLSYFRSLTYDQLRALAAAYKVHIQEKKLIYSSTYLLSLVHNVSESEINKLFEANRDYWATRGYEAVRAFNEVWDERVRDESERKFTSLELGMSTETLDALRKIRDVVLNLVMTSFPILSLGMMAMTSAWMLSGITATAATTTTATATTVATTTATTEGLAGVAAAITSSFQALGPTLTQGILGGISSILTPILVGSIVSSFGLGSWMLNMMLSPVLNALTPTAPITIATAEEAVSRSTAALNSAMNALIGMTVMSEAMSPLKSLGLGYLSAMMGDAAGFRPIIGAILDPHIKASLTIPLAYSVMAKAQPVALSERDLLELFDREEISFEQLVSGMKLHGYSEAVTREKAKLTLTPLKPSQLRQIAQVGKYDRETFEQSMKYGGLEPEQRRLLHTVFQHAELTTEIREVIGVLRRHVKEGFMTVGEMSAVFAVYQGITDALARQSFVASLEYAYDYKNDQRSLHLERFRKKKITRAEAGQGLATIMPDPARVGVLLDREEAKFKVEVVPEPPKEIIPDVPGPLRTLAKEGFITRVELGARFEEYCKEVDPVKRQIWIAEWEYELDYKADLRTLTLTRYRKKKLDRHGAELELAKVMPDPNRVKALLDIEDAKLKIET